MNEVGPHAFIPLRRFVNRGRCRACYLHEQDHPTRRWHAARPLGDSRRLFGPEVGQDRNVAEEWLEQGETNVFEKYRDE